MAESGFTRNNSAAESEDPTGASLLPREVEDRLPLRAEPLPAGAIEQGRLGSEPWPTGRQLGRFKKYPRLSPAPRNDDVIYVEWNLGSNIFPKVSQSV